MAVASRDSLSVGLHQASTSRSRPLSITYPQARVNSPKPAPPHHIPTSDSLYLRSRSPCRTSASFTKLITRLQTFLPLPALDDGPSYQASTPHHHSPSPLSPCPLAWLPTHLPAIPDSAPPASIADAAEHWEPAEEFAPPPSPQEQTAQDLERPPSPDPGGHCPPIEDIGPALYKLQSRAKLLAAGSDRHLKIT